MQQTKTERNEQPLLQLRITFKSSLERGRRRNSPECFLVLLVLFDINKSQLDARCARNVLVFDFFKPRGVVYIGRRLFFDKCDVFITKKSDLCALM